MPGLRRMLERMVGALREQWERGYLQGATAHHTAMANAEALGRIRGYKDILEINYERYLEVMTDEQDKPDRTPTTGPGSPV